MKNLKTIYPTFACLLIVAILTATTFQATFAQTRTDFTNQVSKADAPSDLKSTLNHFQQQRSSNLLNSSTIDVSSYDFAKLSSRNDDAGTPKKSWARKNWWIIPVLAGVGVGIYFLAKNSGSSSSGIRCNDGTISNAQNTQGACSYHGGIAR